MKTEHTPGPWIAEHSGTGDARVVADCGWTNKDETPFKPVIVYRIDWPTAKLIASAPALLAENARLREALRECITESGAHCFTGDNLAEETDLLTRRLGAISDLSRAALQGGGL